MDRSRTGFGGKRAQYGQERPGGGCTVATVEAGGRDVEGPDDGLFPQRGWEGERRPGSALSRHPHHPPHEALGPSHSGLGTADKMQV